MPYRFDDGLVQQVRIGQVRPPSIDSSIDAPGAVEHQQPGLHASQPGRIVFIVGRSKVFTKTVPAGNFHSPVGEKPTLPGMITKRVFAAPSDQNGTTRS